MDLGDAARQLRAVEPQVNGIIARHLRQAHPPVTLSVRRNVLAIPVAGDKHTGLRARIAGAVVGWARETPEGAQAGVAVQPNRTFGDSPGAYFSLPLLMEGPAAGARYSRWRHPVYGHDVWVQQAPHPYFYGPASLLAVTADIAVRGALDEISHGLGA